MKLFWVLKIITSPQGDATKSKNTTTFLGKASMRISTRVALIALSRIRGSLSDFLYADFNRTAGLVFNGAAMPTDCDEASDFVESDDKPYGDDDDDRVDAPSLPPRAHGDDRCVFHRQNNWK